MVEIEKIGLMEEMLGVDSLDELDDEVVEELDVDNIQFNKHRRGLDFINAIPDPEKRSNYMHMVNFAAMGAKPRLSFKKLVLQPFGKFMEYMVKFTQENPELRDEAFLVSGEKAKPSPNG